MKHIDPSTSKGRAEWFTGDVHPTILLAGEEPSRVRMASVHFAPGARTAWHSHATGRPETAWGERVTDAEYGTGRP